MTETISEQALELMRLFMREQAAQQARIHALAQAILAAFPPPRMQNR